MFPFDAAALPQLTGRRALIAVDFQNDFVSPDGALPVSEPEGFVDRALALVAAFRASGDIVWVQSAFDQPLAPDAEPIVVCDAAPLPPPPRSRGRSRNAPPVVAAPPVAHDGGPPDLEAFLSHEDPACVRPSTRGAELAPAVAAAVHKGDTLLRKASYSAFGGTQLLRLLRARMVMEVFICGSLANVGVYATALDAAGHGMGITVVEDCCGFRSETRQLKAVRSLIELTGCEIATSDEVLEAIQPKAKAKAKTPAAPAAAPPAALSASTTPRQRLGASPDIVRPMTGLRLASDSPSPAAEADSKATIAPAHKADSQMEPQESLGTREKKSASPTNDTGDAAAVESRTLPPKRDHDKPAGTAEMASQGTDTTETPTKAKRASMPPAEDSKHAPASDSDDEHPHEQQRGLCEGDTDIIDNVLPPSLEAGIFDALRREVQWQRMSHQGGDVPRLVAVQGAVDEDADGDSIPVYRHPSDEAPPLLPFSPSVLAIKKATEAHLGHPLNHVLIQFYRDGSDYISEHSDKTLDIVPGSYIANVSLGAERTMVLRTKRAAKGPRESSPTVTGDDDAAPRRRTQRARLHHNSLCRMGLRTNMKWLHGIRQDKRLPRDKTPAELAFAGGRISLTFRRIGTFLAAGETLIWGQGATGKTRADARPVINGQGPEAVRMLRAFGAENHASDFDWAAHYGAGFDVLHISGSPRFFASGDAVVNMRIALMLAEYGVGYARGSMAPSPGGKSEEGEEGEEGEQQQQQQQPVAVKFVDNDADKSTVHGDVAIMLYLDACYGQAKASGAPPPTQASLASRFTHFQRALHLLDTYRRHASRPRKDGATPGLPKQLRRELAPWDAALAPGAGFLGGQAPSLPDFALWPVLHAVAEECGAAVAFDGLSSLRRYYEMFAARSCAKKVLLKADVADKS